MKIHLLGFEIEVNKEEECPGHWFMCVKKGGCERHSPQNGYPENH